MSNTDNKKPSGKPKINYYGKYRFYKQLSESFEKQYREESTNAFKAQKRADRKSLWFTVMLWVAALEAVAIVKLLMG